MKVSEIREKLIDRRPSIIGLGKVNAVLIPLVEKEDKLFLLLKKERVQFHKEERFAFLEEGSIKTKTLRKQFFEK